MLALFRKELGSFLNSLIGYIVIAVFLVFTGLLMWVFPFDGNVLDYGFSTIEPLFIMAPWIFLFLIPAITMRSFADERKGGTLELLLTSPVTELQVVMAKFFAGLVIVFLALLPTLVYYYSVYQLGHPVGNIDTGGTIGSYIGLLFLGGAYVSIGVFTSSLTDNQILAFIYGICLCLFMCYGFEAIGSFQLLGGMDDFVLKLGMNDHYNSLSRGVVDTRDLMYFLSVMALFVLLTKVSLESRKW